MTFSGLGRLSANHLTLVPCLYAELLSIYKKVPKSFETNIMLTNLRISDINFCARSETSEILELDNLKFRNVEVLESGNIEILKFRN